MCGDFMAMCQYFEINPSNSQQAASHNVRHTGGGWGVGGIDFEDRFNVFASDTAFHVADIQANIYILMIFWRTVSRIACKGYIIYKGLCQSCLRNFFFWAFFNSAGRPMSALPRREMSG